MNNRILVTGSSGLIGKSICTELMRNGFDVVRFDKRESGEAFGDVLNKDNVASAMNNIQGVIHLAAVSRVVWGEQNPETCWETNVKGLKNVLDVVIGMNPRPWVLFASSREVYGQPDKYPVVESCPLKPVNIYGKSKVEGERLIEIAQKEGIKACTVRLSNVYGSINDHADRVIPAFARAAVLGHELRVDGYLHTFDFTHITDVTKGILSLTELLSAGDIVPPPIHFVSGKPTTLGELAKLAISIAQTDSTIRTSEPRSYDVQYFFGSYKRAQAILGWKPYTNLEAGLAKLINEYRN